MIAGPQTIVQRDLTRDINSGNFQLDTYSISGNGQRISGTDEPSYTYTYSSGDSGVATIDSSGFVTILGLGTTTFKIQSQGNNSYTAAEKTITLTVGNFPIPQAGDNNHLAGWTAALVISAAGLAGLLISSKRRKKIR